MEAHRTHQAGSGLRKSSTSGREKEAAGESRSWTVGLTIRLADGLKTLPPQPPPREPQKSSRTRSRAATALPPHLAKMTAAARMNLPRSLVPCRLVPLLEKPRRKLEPQELRIRGRYRQRQQGRQRSPRGLRPSARSGRTHESCRGRTPRLPLLRRLDHRDPRKAMESPRLPGGIPPSSGQIPWRFVETRRWTSAPQEPLPGA